MKLHEWAEPFRKLGVRANADIPRDAIQARAFGAEGIGLCRTEHMFFGEKKLPHMRAMILANNEKDRRAALKKLLPLQRADFVGVFRAMDGFPVTIRTLDPPLHEFLPTPRRPDGRDRGARSHQTEIAEAEGTANSVASRGRAARVQPHARTSRLPSGHHLSGNHRNAGARHF